FFGIARRDDATFGHFEPQVVAFTGAFSDAGENRKAAMFHRDVVNQLKNQNCFADAGSAEQSDFATLNIRLHQVDNLDASLEHFERGGLFVELRRLPVNGKVVRSVNRTELIHWLAEHVHHAAKRWPANGHSDVIARVDSPHTTNHAFNRFHRNRAYPAFAQMLLHFDGNVQWLRNVVTFAGDTHRVIDRGQVALFELNVEHRSDHLDHSPDAFFALSHCFSPSQRD